ncbi:NAD(P)/FAD-dependent oxidoreductase [Rhodopila sp.]|uniref:NAD(P)/FAD-dependent oxidoreductase n=1 Tax=Rhodopila sp. TaxID=2480087 RepID=UPI003D0F0B7F
MPDTTPTRVVVIGAGFGGLSAVRALRRADASITLIDRENHHTFQPLLYQAATAALSSSDVAWPIRSLVRRQRNVRVVMAEVRGIDVGARQVRTDGPNFQYDHVVLATGSTHSYFGHDEWAAFAPGLKRIADAAAIRQRILLAFERAELADDRAERSRLLTFVIIGGGATGVEMAGAIAEIARDTLRHDFRSIDPANTRVVLIEAGPRLLATLPETLSHYAETALRRMDVDVRLGVQVTGCDAGGVDTQAGRVDASTLIWAAGVRASAAASWIGVTPDRHGRIPVTADLSVPGHPEIHVIGDTAAAQQPDGGPVPGVAPAAKQMGHFVGRRIAALLAGRSVPARFQYRDQGELATIGRKSAVVRIGRVKLTGLIAWLFWSVAHIFFLVTFRDRVVVSLTWAWNYVTFQRSARVVTRPDD